MPHLPPTVLPDTNFLMDYPSVHIEKWLLAPLEIMISETVISELSGLTRSDNPESARKARIALQEIDKFQKAFADLTETHLGVKFKLVERCTDLVEPLNPQIPDHQLIAYARSQLHAEHPRFCAILSNDKELCDIAEALSIIAISRQNEHRFHQELQRKYEWWVKLKKAENSVTVSHQKKQPAKPLEGRPRKQVLLERTVKNLYRRIEAVGCRTTIYLAPLKARLTLTLEIIQRLRSPDRQVVIVVVESNDAAHYWSGEIRQLGGYTSNEVQVFGVDPIERMDRARVVFYRYDQVIRRLPQHISRLNQANKRITTVIDGCDLLGPAELAFLLLECNHFIGLNHLPLGYRQTSGHRMLSIILHDRSLIDYSFADAERDGWGHSCDLYLNPIEFTPDERQEWDNITKNYIKRRERAIKEFPDLAEAEDFWEALNRLLNRAASPEVAELIKQREQLEQMAQISQNKLNEVMRLVHSTPKQPYRRLIFDYTGQWTPVLLINLVAAGFNAAELPDGESQRSTWDKFSGNRLDTLLLSKIPALDLQDVSLHQLIILTPLRPMDEVLSMIDWVLSHTQTKDSLRLDLLYVDDSPEEIAMLELAEASFDLRYS